MSANQGDAFFEEYSGSVGRLEEREVAAIGEESNLAGFSVLDASDAVNFDIGRPFQAAAEFLCDFGKFHAVAPHYFV
jgi:hypothetical protein